MNNLKLNFICEMPKEHFFFWKDGLWAALNYLVNTYNWQVKIFNIPSMNNANIPGGADFYLFWGSLNRYQHRMKFFNKQGLCFGGGPIHHSSMRNFDIIFAESQVDIDEFKKYKANVKKAFGTNTKLFKPMTNQPKIFEHIYPAAFAQWKRHDRFVEFVKKTKSTLPSLAIGYMQPNDWEKECYEVCVNNGVSVLPWVPSETLAYLYNMSKNVLVTADPVGGCQRTVLEGKACNVPVIIESESPKLLELKNLTHEQVLKDWSEASYGEQLKEGIESVL